jgi:hypothetical protein
MLPVGMMVRRLQVVMCRGMMVRRRHHVMLDSLVLLCHAASSKE